MVIFVEQEEEEEENLEPMTETEFAELRTKLRLHKEMWKMITELATYIIFLALLTFIAYGRVDPMAIYLKKSIVKQMKGQGNTVNIRNVSYYIALMCITHTMEPLLQYHYWKSDSKMCPDSWHQYCWNECVYSRALLMTRISVTKRYL